jgi:hypothetical protein
VATPAEGMSCKGSRKGIKIQEFMCRDTLNVKHVVISMPIIIWVTRIVVKCLKGNFGNRTGETFKRLTAKDSYTWQYQTAQKILQSET